MEIFDWSYQPGCSGPPDDDPVCVVCLGNYDNDGCLCPECPACYEEHGLIKTPAQIAQREAVEQAWEEAARAEEEFFSQHREEESEQEIPYVVQK